MPHFPAFTGSGATLLDLREQASGMFKKGDARRLDDAAGPGTIPVGRSPTCVSSPPDAERQRASRSPYRKQLASEMHGKSGNNQVLAREARSERASLRSRSDRPLEARTGTFRSVRFRATVQVNPTFALPRCNLSAMACFETFLLFPPGLPNGRAGQ